jgi:hypothetical protein
MMKKYGKFLVKIIGTRFQSILPETYHSRASNKDTLESLYRKIVSSVLIRSKLRFSKDLFLSLFFFGTNRCVHWENYFEQKEREYRETRRNLIRSAIRKMVFSWNTPLLINANFTSIAIQNRTALVLLDL